VRGDSLPEEVNAWDKSEHGREEVIEGHSLAGEGREMSHDMERKQVKVGTHFLGGEGQTSRETGRKQASMGHSQTGEQRGREML
jgi:hypothetical protein